MVEGGGGGIIAPPLFTYISSPFLLYPLKQFLYIFLQGRGETNNDNLILSQYMWERSKFVDIEGERVEDLYKYPWYSNIFLSLSFTSFFTLLRPTYICILLAHLVIALCVMWWGFSLSLSLRVSSGVERTKT